MDIKHFLALGKKVEEGLRGSVHEVAKIIVIKVLHAAHNIYF